jgi:ribonuclease HI
MLVAEGFFDGCCDPHNPGGHAGWGALLKGSDVRVWSGSGYFPPGPETSNNVAEYSGVSALLEAILSLQKAVQLRQVIIRGDSRLVISQLSGEWQVHGGLYVPMYERAAALLADVQRVSPMLLEWIPREKNSVCDRLSKAELLKRGIRFHIQPGAE